MSTFFDANTDLSGNGSYQGQLSSSYTNALSSYLQTDGADYVAFLAYVANELSVEAALELKAEIEAGNFTLSGLFSAAQSKTGEVDGALISDPEPTLTVTVGDVTYTIDLTAMLTGTDTATWTSGNTKNTVYHTREFFTEGMKPEGYSLDWADPQTNVPPTAMPIDVEIAEFDEYAASKDSEYSEEDAIQYTIDLLSTANDDDGDTLSVVEDSVKLAGGGDLPAYITVDYGTGILTVDRNHASFDELYLGDSWNLEIEYQITDGVNDPISNTVNLTITGTADQFSDTAVVTVTLSDTNIKTVASESYDLLGFDWSNGQVSVSGNGDFDYHNEGFSVTSDLEASYSGINKKSGQNSNGIDDSDVFIDVTVGQVPLAQTWSDDDVLDFSVEFQGPVLAGSTVTVELTYDYWM